jgi:hypothetical protein
MDLPQIVATPAKQASDDILQVGQESGAISTRADLDTIQGASSAMETTM